MKRQAKSIIILFVMVFLILLSAATLDEAYLKTFGWGTILVSDVEYPSKSSMNLSIHDFKKGKNGIFTFSIKGGGDAKLYLRSLLKDGKSIGYNVKKTKDANPEKMKTFKENAYGISLWAEYTFTGEKMINKDDKWPEKISEIPTWLPFYGASFTPSEKSFGWTTFGYNWDKNADFVIEDWLKNAKSGYKIYAVARAGFVRDIPATKTWDSVNERWTYTSEIIYGSPLAAAKIIIK